MFAYLTPAWALAGQSRALMPQDEDLRVLGSLTASEQRQQLYGAAQRRPGRNPAHRPPGSSSRVWLGVEPVIA
jgi:hypothetical protein